MEVDKLVESVRNLDEEIQKFRLHWETQKEWNTRKQFLLHNWKSHVDKDKLISLSCAWSNVRHLGNHYSCSVMQRLKELETGLILPSNVEESSNKETFLNNNQPKLADIKYDKLPEHFNIVRFVKSSNTADKEASSNSHPDITTPSNNNKESSGVTEKVRNDFASVNKSDLNELDELTCNPSKHKLPEKSLCDSLTKTLKKALKIPSTSTIEASSNQTFENGCDSHELTLKIEQLSSTLDAKGGVNCLNAVSLFFAAADRLSLNPKLLCGLAGEQHVRLFNEWRKKSGAKYKVVKFSWVCDVYLDGVFLAQGYGKTETLAKVMAVASALKLVTKPINVCTVVRKATNTMSAWQHSINKTTFSPPIVSLKNAPVIKVAKTPTDLDLLSRNTPPSQTLSNDENLQTSDKKTPAFKPFTKQYCPPTNSSSAIPKQKSTFSSEPKTAIVSNALRNDSKNRTSAVKSSKAETSAGNMKTSESDLASKSELNIPTIVNEYSQAIKEKSDFFGKPSKKISFRLKNMLRNFVVVVAASANDPTVMLRETADQNHFPVDFQFVDDGLLKTEPHFFCSINLNGFELATGEGASKTVAKSAASDAALRILIQHCPCLIKVKVPGNVDNLLERKNVLQNSSTHSALSSDQPLSAENIGNKMLRKMGWSGAGGLGKSEKGIVEPVSAEGKLVEGCYAGIGHSSDGSNAIQFRDAERVIRQYVNNGCNGDLSFSSELTSDERKKLHFIARKHGLKSKSYGKNENRRIVVFKNLSLQEIYQQLLTFGGEINGFVLPN